MTGIDLKLPVFLYRMHPKTKDLEQVEYVAVGSIKWTKSIAGRTGLGGASPEELSNSRWTIYKFDMSSRKSDMLVSGTSLKAYEAYIQTSEFSAIHLQSFLPGKCLKQLSNASEWGQAYNAGKG